MGSTFLGSVPFTVGLRRDCVSQLQHRAIVSCPSWGQLQWVPGTDQGQRPNASAVARAAPSKSLFHRRRLDRSLLSKETKSCYVALHVTLVWWWEGQVNGCMFFSQLDSHGIPHLLILFPGIKDKEQMRIIKLKAPIIFHIPETLHNLYLIP